MPPITATDVQEMVTHWLGCPPNGYLGSGYGSDLHSMLQEPLGGPAADSVVAKLREDIRVIGQLPAGAVNILANRLPPDRLNISIDVAGTLVDAASLGGGNVSQG